MVIEEEVIGNVTNKIYDGVEAFLIGGLSLAIGIRYNEYISNLIDNNSKFFDILGPSITLFLLTIISVLITILLGCIQSKFFTKKEIVKKVITKDK